MSKNSEQRNTSSISSSEPAVNESVEVNETTVDDKNANNAAAEQINDDALQTEFTNQSNDTLMITMSDVCRQNASTTTSDTTNNAPISSGQHPSAWTADEVKAWFQAHKLDKLYQTLFALSTPLDGQALAQIFESKLRNYDSYRNRYTMRLRNHDRNLLLEFYRFGQLLDTYFTDSYTHRFDIAFSFPGERRNTVSKIAEILCKKINAKTNENIGKKRIFYDKYHEAELARPNLDLYLQAIYRYNVRLIVVFMCDEYDQKEWCGLESRSIRGLLKARQNHRIMLLSFDNCTMEGITDIDGYINIDGKSAKFVAEKIYERLQMLGEPSASTQTSFSASTTERNTGSSRQRISSTTCNLKRRKRKCKRKRIQTSKKRA